jgi:2'-5' RNA ligase
MSMRAFLALPIPSPVRAALKALQEDLARAGADVKWVAPENLHVTLKFLDEISEEERGKVEDALRRLAARTAPFTLRLERVGAFPSPGAPRVVWAGVGDGKEPLTRLADAVEAEMRTLNLRKEERPFAAHVTLGRVRSPTRRQSLAARLQGLVWEPPPAWQAASVTLQQSVLSSHGPRYTVLADVPLSGGP